MSEFITYLKDVFQEFGAIKTRKMFGGYGIFRDGLMFGLVADDVLYLKVDAQSEPLFEAEGMSPFMYDKGGKMVKMSYYTAPEAIYDEPSEARQWGQVAFEAAVRAKS